MDLVIYSGIFIACAGMLYIAGEWVVGGLMRLSRLFVIREFVLAFFVMSMGASIPNLFLGVTSAIGGIPELSLGDILGNNIVAMTVAVAAGVFFTSRGFVEAGGKTVRTSMFFTLIAAILPILLITDGDLSRVDGLVLLGLFTIYILWLLSQRDRFSKRYNGTDKRESILKRARLAFSDVFKVVAGIALVLIATIGIVSSASFFAGYFGVSLLIIGLLIVGLGSALPEIYFSIASARQDNTEFVLSNIMGAVIIPATLVLGIVALIHPIQTDGLELLTESRMVLAAAAVLFFIFAATHRRINRFEAIILLVLYASFVSWAIFAS